MKISLSNPNEKKVAKNTMLLFIRMAFIMIINLLAVRYVRKGLGIEDYGILNAVTGIVLIVTCLKSILATSTQRFISIAMGRGDTDNAAESFSVSVKLSRIISFVVLLGMESIGLWFVLTHMNCPETRFTAMIIVYQLSIANFILTLIQVPYLAVVLAYEKMSVFSMVTVLEALINFAAAILVFEVPGDRMVFYAFMLVLSNMLGYILYRVYVFRRINDISYRTVKDRKLYHQVLSFSGWTIYGSIAGSLMFQGNMLALNIFVGPVANAAFAVALQFYNALSSFGNNIIMAVRPQMVMNYSQGNYKQLNRLFYLSTISIAVFLSLLIAPMVIWMPDILKIWLGDADAMTVVFSRIMLVVAFVMMIGMPITIIMHAVGCVKQYHLMVETITILCLPASYLLLRLGYPPEGTCLSVLGFLTLAHIARLFCLLKYYFKKI